MYHLLVDDSSPALANDSSAQSKKYLLNTLELLQTTRGLSMPSSGGQSVSGSVRNRSDSASVGQSVSGSASAGALFEFGKLIFTCYMKEIYFKLTNFTIESYFYKDNFLYQFAIDEINKITDINLLDQYKNVCQIMSESIYCEISDSMYVNIMMYIRGLLTYDIDDKEETLRRFIRSSISGQQIKIMQLRQYRGILSLEEINNLNHVQWRRLAREIIDCFRC